MSGAALAAGVGTAVGTVASGAMSDSGGAERRRDPTMTPEQMELLNTLAGTVKSRVGEGVDAWPGTRVPDPTETQQQVAGEAGTLFDQVMAEAERGEGLLQREEWDPERSQERWQQTVAEPARRQWEQEAVPQIMEQYGARNALDSSALNRALGRSREDLSSNLAAQLGEMTYRDYERHQVEQRQRAQLGQSLLGSALQQAQGTAGLSDIPRQIEQQQAAEERQKWLYERPYNNPWVENYGQMGGGAAQPNYGTGGYAASQGYNVRPNYYGGGTTAPFGVGT